MQILGSIEGNDRRSPSPSIVELCVIWIYPVRVRACVGSDSMLNTQRNARFVFLYAGIDFALVWIGLCVRKDLILLCPTRNAHFCLSVYRSAGLEGGRGEAAALDSKGGGSANRSRGGGRLG